MNDVRGLPVGSACQLAAVGPSFQAYNEEAFRYFLALEHRRAARSGGWLLLLLASLRGDAAGRRSAMGGFVAQKFFAGLWLCTRETDFIGWYREGRVAGAVLTQRSAAPSCDIVRDIRTRATDVLCSAVPRRAQQRVRVCVHQLVPTRAAGAAAPAEALSDHEYAS